MNGLSAWLTGGIGKQRVIHDFPKVLLGCALAIALLIGLAETFLRIFPSKDVSAYLGEASPLTGPYRQDDDFGVSYQSWEAFLADNAERMRPFLPFEGNPDARKIWGFFGNSFVQAPNMLADQVRTVVKDRRVFNLGKNEHLLLRLAQIKLLLEHGMEPERIFLALAPVDMLYLGDQPLSTIYVTSKGALTYRPQMPAGLVVRVVQQSELARRAWFRTGWHRGNPSFKMRKLKEGVGEPLLSDLRRLFANLASLTKERQVPVTIILIPQYHQVVKGMSYGFQNSIARMLRQLGFDVFDPRSAFSSQPHPAALYAPDKHLSLLGNEVLANELLAHLRAGETRPDPSTDASSP